MYKFELHLHTDESSNCGKVPAKDAVELYMANGYDGFVVTDHFNPVACGGPERFSKDGTKLSEEESVYWWNVVVDRFLKGYQTAKAVAEGKNFQVLLGMELRFPGDENDYLVYGIDEEFLRSNPWFYMEQLPDFYKIAQERGFTIVQAHPFRVMCYLAYPKYLHGIEVYNGNPRHKSHNEVANAAADIYGKIKVESSDFHQLEDISRHYMVFETMPQTSMDVAKMLRERNFTTAVG